MAPHTLAVTGYPTLTRAYACPTSRSSRSADCLNFFVSMASSAVDWLLQPLANLRLRRCEAPTVRGGETTRS